MRKAYTFSAKEETTGMALDILSCLHRKDRSKTIAYCIQKVFQEENEKNPKAIETAKRAIEEAKKLGII